MKYAIFYDYTNEEGYEEKNIVEHFKGTWAELQETIKVIKQHGCYNICSVLLSQI